MQLTDNKNNQLQDCKCVECNIPQYLMNDLPFRIGLSFEIWHRHEPQKHLGIGLVKINP